MKRFFSSLVFATVATALLSARQLTPLYGVKTVLSQTVKQYVVKPKATMPAHWKQLQSDDRRMRGPILHQFDWHRMVLDECHEIVDTFDANTTNMAIIQSIEVRRTVIRDSIGMLGLRQCCYLSARWCRHSSPVGAQPAVCGGAQRWQGGTLRLTLFFASGVWRPTCGGEACCHTAETTRREDIYLRVRMRSAICTAASCAHASDLDGSDRVAERTPGDTVVGVWLVQSRHVWCVTGTPFPNGDKSMYGIHCLLGLRLKLHVSNDLFARYVYTLAASCRAIRAPPYSSEPVRRVLLHAALTSTANSTFHTATSRWQPRTRSRCSSGGSTCRTRRRAWDRSGPTSTEAASSPCSTPCCCPSPTVCARPPVRPPHVAGHTHGTRHGEAGRSQRRRRRCVCFWGRTFSGREGLFRR